MPVSPIALQLPDVMLTADRLSTLLEASGYRSTMSIIRGSHVLPPGFRVVLQFGDHMSSDADGVARMTIRASLILSGSDRRAGEATTRWQLGKSVPTFVGNTASSFVIEADLLLGTAIGFDDVLVRGGEFTRHLRLLIQDARATLAALPVNNRTDAKTRGPVMRIEARLASGIVAGRSGILRPTDGVTVRTSVQHVLCGIAACNCLDDQILPELARAARSTIAQVRSRGAVLDDDSAHAWRQKQVPNPVNTVSEILQ